MRSRWFFSFAACVAGAGVATTQPAQWPLPSHSEQIPSLTAPANRVANELSLHGRTALLADANDAMPDDIDTAARRAFDERDGNRAALPAPPEKHNNRHREDSR